MTAASPGLRRFIRKFRSSRSLVCERLGGKFMPLGADSQTLDALNASFHLPDEVHAHRDPLVWILVDTSMAARRQPITFAMTTAGVYDSEAIDKATGSMIEPKADKHLGCQGEPRAVVVAGGNIFVGTSAGEVVMAALVRKQLMQ